MGVVGSSSWLDQFSEAFTVQADDDDEEGEDGEEGEEKMPSCGDYIMHFLTLPWKLIFAFIPPTAMANGYITFVVSIAFIGACTAIIGDVAGHLGCFINLKDGVNAIAFVALGTSVPDTFASKTAAIEDETADNSVGNVTLQRCQRVPWYRHRLDHGRHLLGVPGRVLHCPRRKPGLLCDHLLSGSSVCHPHPFGKTTSCCGWRARWTQDLQNNFIFPLRLLLVFLRHDLRSGDVRRH